MKAHWLFLGTGASAGVPVIGCYCAVCSSSDPRNKRSRPSALLTLDTQKILIDAGPDVRTQALRFGVDHVDGVLITHTHYDHIGGIDDLRIFYIRSKKLLPLLLSKTSYEEIRTRLPYLFREKISGVSLTAQFNFHILEEKRGNVEFLGIPIHFMTFEQGGMEVTGFRIGSLAYISDIYKYPETIFEDLFGVKTLILSALKKVKTKMHFSIDEAIDFGRRAGAQKIYLMHVSHELEHVMTNTQMPEGVELAYDGLSFEDEI